MKIVLYQPEIPQNTGNIVRLAAATGSELHLIEPLGFFLDEKRVRRAGLDYWDLLSVIQVHSSLEALLEKVGGQAWYIETGGVRRYDQVQYGPDDLLIFGSETKGLPKDLVEQQWEWVVNIPMANQARSLNLANSVSIVLYEGLRQQGFLDLTRR